MSAPAIDPAPAAVVVYWTPEQAKQVLVAIGRSAVGDVRPELASAAHQLSIALREAVAL